MERITSDMPEELTRGHRFRYHLAAGFACPGDWVVDAACGSGYGGSILMRRGKINYYGVDKSFQVVTENIQTDTGLVIISPGDLETWVPDIEFDIFVGFETIEHLDDYTAYLKAASEARKWVLLSTPVVPTMGVNPYHRHDFGRGQLVDLFQSPNWDLFQIVDQPSEKSEIYVFRRR